MLCREDMGTEYARKLEELHREEQLIQEEELEAEALLCSPNGKPSVAADEVLALQSTNARDDLECDLIFSRSDGLGDHLKQTLDRTVACAPLARQQRCLLAGVLKHCTRWTS